jgi:hypothetical protein
LVIDFLNAKFGFMTSMKIVAAFFIAIIWLGAFWRIRKCIGPERKQP